MKLNNHAYLFILLILLTPISSAASEKVSGVIVSPEGFCAKEPHDNIDYWESAVDHILIGKVLEVRPRFNGEGAFGNRCWVHLKVLNSIKGNNGSDIWSKITYSQYKWPYTGERMDITDPQSCPLKIDQEYLVFGKSNLQTNGRNPSLDHYILAGSGAPTDNCTPLLPLKDAENLLKKLNVR